MYVCKAMPRRYLGFGHERLNPKKVSEKAKLFMEAKTSVDKNHSNAVTQARGGGGGGGSNFPYILLNEIQTMFSQLAKQSSRQ